MAVAAGRGHRAASVGCENSTENQTASPQRSLHCSSEGLTSGYAMNNRLHRSGRPTGNVRAAVHSRWAGATSTRGDHDPNHPRQGS